MGKRGPPPIQINWEAFDRLVSYQCTEIEIADWFGCSVDTLDNACQRDLGEKLSDIWRKRKSFGKVRLRKAQFNIVEKAGPGAATMAIYLDKKIFPEERFDVPKAVVGAGTPVGASLKKKTFGEFCESAGYPLPYDKQLEMLNFAITVDEVRMILGSRGYGKTDYLTVLGVAYGVYCNWFDGLHLNKESASTNLIITKSKSRNTMIIEEIKHALESSGVTFDKATGAILRVKGLRGKDHSVEAITLRTSLRGRHPKLVVFDDIVTEEDVSDAMRRLVKRKYNETYKLCKNIVLIGQPAHSFDLYAELREKIKTLLIPHGTIPELDADLEAMRIAGVDPKSIAMSYHLVVPVDGTHPFAGIKYIDQMPAGTKVAFIDPSDGGDLTACSIITQFFDGVAVEGKAWAMAWYHCLDELVPWLVAHKVERVAFETNATGRDPIRQLKELLAPYGIGVVAKHSDTNKHAVIMAAGAYSHLIHLSKASDHRYTEHVIRYEKGAKIDDPPDSLARGLEWLGLIRGKK